MFDAVYRMMADIFSSISTQFADSYLSIIVSSVIGGLIACYIYKVNENKKQKSDKMNWNAINEYCKKAQKIYNTIYSYSDKSLKTKKIN